jgi:hypothetical protein
VDDGLGARRPRIALKNQARHGIQGFVTKGPERRFIDDLPSLNISRLRGAGVITTETTEFVVPLGDVDQVVGVTLARFPNGGSWSRFLAPCCGKRAKTLRLLNGRVLCWRCCMRRGLRYRCEPTGATQRAAMRTPKLLAMLNSDKPLRLKPSTLWGTMERRSMHEASLQRNLLILRRHELAALNRELDKTRAD